MARAAKSGWIEVICGSMFSGKTEELIRRLRRASIAKQKVKIFKPAIDQRYSESSVTSHSNQSLDSQAIEKAEEILDHLDPGTDVVGLDEAQFMGPKVPEIANILADRGIRVIAAGLDQDYLGRPFEPMPALMAIAEYVTKCQAICVVCGAPASKSQRIVGDTDRVKVGAADSYEARCRRCFDPHLSERMAKSMDNDIKVSLSMQNQETGRGIEGQPVF